MSASCDVCNELASKKEKARTARATKKQKDEKAWEENPIKCARTKSGKDIKKATKLLNEMVECITKHSLVDEAGELRGILVESAQKLVEVADDPGDPDEE